VIEVFENTIQNRTFINIEHREDSSFDAQDGRVEVLAIAEDVELDVVVAEAEDVSLLELGGEAVLLRVAGPHLAARGHRPAVVVQPEVGVEVGGRGADARAPHAALLHLHLPVRLVLEDGRAAPGCSGAAEPQPVLDHDGLVPHGGGVQDHLGDPLAGGDGGHGPAPLAPALAVQAVGHQGQALAEHRRHATWQPHVSRGGP